MDTSYAIKGECAVLCPEGQLNLLTAVKLKDTLIALVGQGVRLLVVDLSSVPFIDTSGLGALISGLKTARLAGGDLRLAQVDSRARQLLQITSLDRVLTVHESVEEALRAFEPSNDGSHKK